MRWTAHPVIVTVQDHSEKYEFLLILLLYHYYRTLNPKPITGWGGPPKLDRLLRVLPADLSEDLAISVSRL